MDDLITRLELLPLTGADLVMMSNKLGNAKTRFIIYDNLRNIKKVDELFAGVNSVFILFQIRNMSGPPSVGHWAVLIKTRKGLSYYDPYGLVLSEDIELSGEPAWLEKLLKGQEVEMNRHRHQKFRNEVQTCGRHTVVRSVFHFMTNDEYDRLVIKPILHFVEDADVFVSIMTAFLDDTDEVIRAFFKSKVDP